MVRAATFAVMILLLLCGVIAHGCIGKPAQSATEGTGSLLVYCGAGMRSPMNELVGQFEQDCGVNVVCNYAGSGHLLNQIELAQEGDVYQPGSTYYCDIAREKGLIDYEKRVAYHVPVIAVPKGNPASITCLNDLAKPGVKVALGDPEACAIGRLGDKILEKNGIKDDVEDNVVARGTTVNALIVYVSGGDVDAAIVWEETSLFAPDTTDIIKMPEEENIIKIIPIGALMFSENKEAARKFVDFITSDCGKAIYEKYGFTPYRQGDIGDINETNR
ncbi:MAG: molybdate ABC transporter substrate-binding protein [Euryarchaeota archaeon]|nr:molybdate ABC transporter substrate-binding protein [Euryarchaeota archaeon]